MDKRRRLLRLARRAPFGSKGSSMKIGSSDGLAMDGVDNVGRRVIGGRVTGLFRSLRSRISSRSVN